MDEITLTLKLVVAAIIGGVTVFPMLKTDMPKEKESQIAWIFFSIAIAVFIFFDVVMVIIGIIAAMFGFMRLAPILAKEGSTAVSKVRTEVEKSRGPRIEQKRDPLERLKGQVPEDVRQEMIEWMGNRE